MTIDIFGYIEKDYWGDGFSIDAKSIRNALNQLQPDEPLEIYINSPGGEVMEGLSIYNLLAEKSPIVKIVGEATSIASVISCAGKEVWIAETALMLIHKPWITTWGNEDDLTKTTGNLKTIKDSILKAYQTKTGKTLDELESIMAQEKYWSAQECVDMGFADKLWKPSVQDENKAKIYASRNINKYFARNQKVNKNENNFNKKDEVNDMTEVEYQNRVNAFDLERTSLQKEIADLKNQVKDYNDLQTANNQFKLEIKSKQEENEKLKLEKVKSEVAFDLEKLKMKILPVENCQENNFELTQDLMFLKTLDNNESAKINGLTPYQRRIKDIENRDKDYSVLGKKLEVEKNKKLDLPHLDLTDKEQSAQFSEMIKARVDKDKISYKEATNLILMEIENENR